MVVSGAGDGQMHCLCLHLLARMAWKHTQTVKTEPIRSFRADGRGLLFTPFVVYPICILPIMGGAMDSSMAPRAPTPRWNPEGLSSLGTGPRPEPRARHGPPDNHGSVGPWLDRSGHGKTHDRQTRLWGNPRGLSTLGQVYGHTP